MSVYSTVQDINVIAIYSAHTRVQYTCVCVYSIYLCYILAVTLTHLTKSHLDNTLFNRDGG